tara:strand:- start:556 stop:2187 length:1632 start_codon:yes stop_codon:yes gene_type:complete
MQKEILELQKLIKNRNIDKAYEIAKRLSKTDINNKEVIKILTFLYIQRGQFDAAIDRLEKYYNDNPNEKDFDYFINMGVSLKSVEEFQKSLEMYKEAQKINPESPLCYTVPAEINLKIRNFDESLRLINIALDKINKSDARDSIHFPNAIKLKTEINVALQKDEENMEMLKSYLREEFHPDIFYLLATVNPSIIDDELLNLAQKHLQHNDDAFQNNLDRFWFVHPLYFALAIYYEKKDKKKSEDFYHLGNNETMKSLRYNSFSYQKNISNTMDNYKNTFENVSLDNDDVGSKNIFILGTPRSGTTLIESFIASNEDVKSGGELLSASKMIEDYVNREKDFTVDVFINEFRKKYLSRVSFLRGEFSQIVDKLPENFLYIGQLLKLLPNARVIRTFRNPWDVATSLYKQRYVTNIPYSSSFFNLGVFMSNFEAVNKFWNESIADKGHLLDVKYEDLIKDTDFFQKKIYKFLNIKSEYNENKRMGFFAQTASIRQIGSPVHSRSIEKRDFLDKKDEFYDALLMQRKYWEKRGFKYENNDFFGYKLN